MTRGGRPITRPMGTYLSPAGTTVKVCTGVTYRAKAHGARRNPRVGLLMGGRGSTLSLNPVEIRWRDSGVLDGPGVPWSAQDRDDVVH